MAVTATAREQEFEATGRAIGDGRTLAATMPRLILEARRVAATVIHGLHGRRRAGPGENFWQYRRFVSGEPAARVDWRRSARDDHLYVREQEWEAAHTVWLWPDRSPSMAFAFAARRSDTKLERALVIAFALAEVLVEGGERVGIPGLMRPSASRNIIEKMAQAIVHDPAERTSLPPSFSPSPLAEIVMLSDLWSPIAEVHRTIAQLSAERRPRPRRPDRRSGRRDLSLCRPHRVRRAGRRRRDHRRPRRDLARRLRGARRPPSRRDPRRDRPAGLELRHPSHRPLRRPTFLLKLHAQLGAGREGTGINRWHAVVAAGETAHDPRPAARLRPAAGPARPAEPAGAVVAAAAGAAAAAAHRLSADPAPVRHRAQGRDAGAHAVVADAAAADARRARHPRGRRTVVESAARDLAGATRRSPS